jgi:sodium/hydrogen exchanger 10/11
MPYETDGHPLFALALGAALGALVTHLLSRCCPKVPYTPTLLLLGVVVAVVKRFALSPEETPSSFASLDEWENIDGHLLLLVFLPPLLFVDTIHLEWHRTYKCLGQCIVLAGPGVLVSAGLTAVYVRFVLPYGWGWDLALAFGSVLAATDPVAVVALLNELGASPVLTALLICLYPASSPSPLPTSSVAVSPCQSDPNPTHRCSQ